MMFEFWWDWEKYLDERGINVSGCAMYSDVKRTLSLELFGDAMYLEHVSDDAINYLLGDVSRIGAEKAASQFRQRREERAEKMEIERQRWDNLREKFGGIVISMDSKIDIYSTGFSVRVLLNSETSFAERKKFLKENRTEFLKWLMYELMRNVKTSRRIGDISFYKPVEMTLLRVPEVEVKFEVKAA